MKKRRLSRFYKASGHHCKRARSPFDFAASSRAWRGLGIFQLVVYGLTQIKVDRTWEA
jgi:hypothetical protein